jgi:serine/threonine-protein kinase HipA
MISEPAPTGCFVYITLPGTTEAVTAARFELTANRSGVPLGRLVYGKCYLARGDTVAFDPVDAMKERVKGTWYETARSAGVSDKDCERIAGAFGYPGFDLEHVQPRM